MAFSHPRATMSNFRFFTFFVIVLIHVAAVFSAFYFSWQGLVAFVVLYYLTGCVGITLTYHRLLTHKSFRMAGPLRALTVLCACLALQGSPLWWTAHHRLHHRESDQVQDPHSPRSGFWWSHIGWLFYTHPMIHGMEDYKKLVPDLVEDPFLRFMEYAFLPFNILFGVVLFGIVHHYMGMYMAMSMLLWAGPLRIVATWHVTWLVNSATHIWGYQRYNANDDSQNNWVVAMLTFGEGWHNNHHAQQRSAASGHFWYEFDLTYWIIKGLSMVGLVSHIIPVTKRQPKLAKLVKRQKPAYSATGN